jgi:hypothetical protein
MRFAAPALLLAAFAGTAAAQQPAAPDHAEMKRLSFLVGEWKGEGWKELAPGQRSSSGIHEKVEVKLGGAVLAVEGRGTNPGPNGTEITVHHAFATIGWDARAKVYRMRSHLSTGQSVDAEASFVDEGFQWRFEFPGYGKTRYTVKLNERGEWYEYGEHSTDGTTWRRIHEMTLRRIAR